MGGALLLLDPTPEDLKKVLALLPRKMYPQSLTQSSECPQTSPRQSRPPPSPLQSCLHSSMLPMQVLDKHGDIYGRERIAELLGMDLATLEITAHNERKPEPPPGLLTW